MTYASLDDLIARAGRTEILQVADRDDDGTPDPEVIAAALQDADNLVNGYVGARYTLPLLSTPSLVRTWATAIARYVLHRDGPPDYVTDDYDSAVSALKDVARGLISLPDAAGQEPAVAAGTVMASAPPAVFTPSHLRGWREDC